ncbi:MAG: hypothetical protein ACTSQF_15345 [Candidatus Heimdallarchaeaceae archaeon]
MQKSQSKITVHWFLLILFWITSSVAAIIGSIKWFQVGEFPSGILLLLPVFMFILFFVLYLVRFIISQRTVIFFLLVSFIGPLYAFFTSIVYMMDSDALDFLGVFIALPSILVALIIGILSTRSQSKELQRENTTS